VRLSLKGSLDHVSFQIEDDGIGMDRETREKAFTLFFSSKGGEGTGLGLFIAHKIAQAHGGNITVESEEGQGRASSSRCLEIAPCPRERGSIEPRLR